MRLSLIPIAIAVLTAGNPSWGEARPPLEVCLVSGSAEYDSDTSLTALKQYLEEGYDARCILLKARGFEDLPGLEALDDCDVALFFTRRLTLDREQLARVKKYCLSGKPLVAVRTASHGFQNWLEFDKLILGGNYHNHFEGGPALTVTVAPAARDHPVLHGVGPLDSTASLYKTAPLVEGCKLLLTGLTLESGGPQPVAWARTHMGARVFYTSLGAQSDFANPAFRRLLANALFWTAGRGTAEKQP